MHKYLVQIGDDFSNHFRKYNYFSEVENCIHKENTNTFTNVSNGSFGLTNETPHRYDNLGSHVYRIKDIMDAINTSVIIEGKQREGYIQMLSSTQTNLNVDPEFVAICRNVGECDTM